jgi:hypothetical protein
MVRRFRILLECLIRVPSAIEARGIGERPLSDPKPAFRAANPIGCSWPKSDHRPALK